MLNHFKKHLKIIPAAVWILLAIILIGIFLRTYHFRDWIYASSDQVRDARLAEDVIAGNSAWPSFGPHMNHADVYVGPIYYYFQIISAKIFGIGLEKMAYPDLFFSILSIPLLYFFLKRYFSNNLSLALTSLYSISFYSIQYSRFALNPNMSSFFAILFLMSLLEFIEAKEKARWIWIISLGISLGVGVQLHAITLILFLMITFLVFIYLMKKNWRVWNRWLVVILIMLFLNLGQIIGDFKNNFSNTKSFLKYSLNKSSDSSKNSLGQDLKMNIDCQIQANFFIASAVGDEEICTSTYAKLISGKGTSYFKKIIKTSPYSLIAMFLAVLFFIFGYWLSTYSFRKEKEGIKKHFLGLIILYALLSFLIMLPIGDWMVLRYFTHIMFIPFILLGLIIDFLIKKFPKTNIFLIIPIFSFFVISNLIYISLAAKDYLTENRSHYNYAVLGEMDSMLDYISSESYPEKEAYYFVESDSAWTVFFSLDYESQRKNFNLIRILRQDYDKITSKHKLFYIKHIADSKPESKINGREVLSSKKIGQFIAYELKN
jgi:4-amino-4-deoxy-L-arabinose transferase-like glycosyltransferase